uniref:Kinesinlike protein putative n=1 Tax=Albugo laibachii Nc14 TaxID=890382 RepID=F0VYS2_9STRA|nr:kinesinlike protein putative [Albugo laibachii Nc14]|eukprot:CCA13936.1 kinesinlike protein putative [Albugo laibachii Nc14]
MQSDGKNDCESQPRCCVCFDNSDNWTGVLIQCSSCKIDVHTRCYGLNESNQLQTWQCERCSYLQSAPKDTLDDDKIVPYCAICPVEGGALKQSIHSGVWCHVVCSYWIPELSHSVKANTMHAIDLSILDPSRENLRCLVCGQRGGCIQCLSKRCARSFHVICAIRSPSNLVFTGYDQHNHQAYHCHAHSPEARNQSGMIEIVDSEWRQKQKLRELLDSRRDQAGNLIDGNGKCIICNTKVGPSALGKHQVKCMLSWLTGMELDARRVALEKRNQTPIKIPYQPSVASVMNSESGAAHNIRRTNSILDQKKNSVEKKNHSLSVRRPCPECGELIKDTYLMSHLRRRCSQKIESTHHKRGRLKKSYIKRRSFSKKNGTTHRRNLINDYELENGDRPSTNASDGKDPHLSQDVLFSRWPGQTTGDRMDTSYFWTIVQNHFFCSTISDKQRLDKLSRDFCGAEFPDLTIRPKPGDSMECKHIAVMTREHNSSNGQYMQCLHLKELIHQCDFMMRASRVKCPEDFYSRLRIEIGHQDKPPSDLSKPQSVKETNGHKVIIREDYNREHLMASPKSSFADQALSNSVTIQFKSQNIVVRCLLHLRLHQKETEVSDRLPGMETVWSKYIADPNHLIIGCDPQPVSNMESSTALWTSMQLLSDDTCSKLCTDIDATADELTPQVNFLIENLREQARHNRTNLRSVCFRFKCTAQTQTQSHFESEIVESYYIELAWWKVVRKSILAGFSLAISLGDRTLGSKSSEYLDDGTCVVCFDGQSLEANPIIFCDRCDLAVHQHCYGITKVPSNEFLCDRCRNQDGSRISIDDATSKVFCQLCPVQDGAFKQTIDGKWVHVVCALWSPGVWIGNFTSMAGIDLAASTLTPRFIDTLAETEVLCRQSRQSFSTEVESESSADIAALHRLKRGSLCITCRVSCGRTIQCSSENCRCSFHPLCAWYAGVPMFIDQSPNTIIYAGGGTGLKFSILCYDHAHVVGADRQYILDQRARRRRLRIDLYYRTSSKKGRFHEARPSWTDQHSQKANEAASNSLLWGGLHEDTDFCAACFHYASPSTHETYPEKLHGRQFLLRCLQCNTFIHAACAISEIGPRFESEQSDWVCEKCKLRAGKIRAPRCVVCDGSGDYMMPCAEAEASTSWKFNERIRGLLPAFACGVHTQNAEAKTSGGSIVAPSHRDEWMHVFCSKWIKARYFRRSKILFALKPSLTADHLFRCDLCSRKTDQYVKCENCPKAFHPICAARQNYFIAYGARNIRKVCCGAHTPNNAAFDFKRQMWITEEALQHLHAVRYAFERGRLLVEMCRQREKQKKRVLLANLFPLLQQSLDIVITKRPSQSMKDVYSIFTGGALVEPRPVVRRPKAVSVQIKVKSKRSTRRNTMKNTKSKTQSSKVEKDAGLVMGELRRSTRRLESKTKTPSTSRDGAKRRESDTLCESPLRKRQRRESNPTAAQVISAFRDFSEQEINFDEVIPQQYPELA